MYIHLGNDIIIPASDVIVILNIEEPISPDLQEIIEIAELEKKLVRIGGKDKRKALVICDHINYISPISSTTLYKRAENFYKEV
jgi:hypothetical protein